MKDENLDFLLQRANQYYQQLLNIKPRRTKLQTLKREEWQDFCNRFNLNCNSEGIFLPRNLTAYLLEDSENLSLNLFHEYFGHGLFCEYSKQGKFLERLERRLVREERQKFKGRRFSQQELQNFRKQNPNFRLLQKEKEEGLGLYEAFAVWTEQYLSNLFSMKDRFEQKYKEIPKEIKENLEQFLNFQKSYGKLALLYETGLPKYYNKEKVKTLLEGIFTDKIKSAQLVLLYGSRKPYSDIDLFAVSREIGDFSNGWLDIFSLKPEEFEYRISVFDIAVTDPLLTGELILGDKGYFEQKRNQILTQPITQEAIYYNLIKSKQQKILAKEYPTNLEEYKRGKSYAETFMKNALALKQGKRKLTKSSLIA